MSEKRQQGRDGRPLNADTQPPIGSRAAREQHQEQRVRQRGGQVYRSGPLQLNIPMRPPLNASAIPTQSRPSGERERLPIPSPFNNPPMRATAMTNLFRNTLSRSPVPQQLHPSISPSPLFGSNIGSPSVGPAATHSSQHVDSPVSLSQRSISSRALDAGLRSSSERSRSRSRGGNFDEENFQTQDTLIEPSQRDSDGSSGGSNQGRAGSIGNRSLSSSASNPPNDRSSSSEEERRLRTQSERSKNRDSLSSRRDRLTDINSFNQRVGQNDRDILFEQTPLFSDRGSFGLDDRDMSADKSILSDREKRMSTQLIQSRRPTPPPTTKRDKGKGRARVEKENRQDDDVEMEEGDVSREPLEDFDSLIAPTPEQAPAKKKTKRKSEKKEEKEKRARMEKRARKSEKKEEKEKRARIEKKARKSDKGKRKSRVADEADVKSEDGETQPPPKEPVKKTQKKKKSKEEAEGRRSRRRQGGVEEVRSDEEDEASTRTSRKTSTDAVFKVPEIPIKRKRKSAIRQAYRDGRTQADVDREEAAATKEATRLAKKRKKDRRIDDEEVHLFHTIFLSDQTLSNPFTEDIDKKHQAVASRAITKSQRQINEIDVFWNLMVNEVDDVIDQTESRTLLHDIRHFNALLEKEFTERTVWFEYCIALNARLTTAKAQQKDLRKQILNTQKSIAQVSKTMSGVQLEWTQSKLHREEMSKLNLWMNDVQSRRIPLQPDEDMTIDKKATVKLKDELTDIYSSLALIRPVFSTDDNSLSNNLSRFGLTYDCAAERNMFEQEDDDGLIPTDPRYEDKVYELEIENATIVGDENIAAAENDEGLFSDDESIGSVSTDDISISSDKVSVSEDSDFEDEQSPQGSTTNGDQQAPTAERSPSPDGSPPAEPNVSSSFKYSKSPDPDLEKTRFSQSPMSRHSRSGSRSDRG